MERREKKKEKEQSKYFYFRNIILSVSFERYVKTKELNLAEDATISFFFSESSFYYL